MSEQLGHAARVSGTAVGVERPRPDSREKVVGATRYSDDLRVEGLLHARLVQSVYAHARIRSIDSAAALQVPGVVAILTARDLPIRGRNAMRMFEPLAVDEALFAGQPLALVVAETDQAAADAADLVVVDAEPLDPVVDVLEAMTAASPPVRALRPEGDEDEAGADARSAHAAVGGGGAALEDEELSDNVAGRKRYRGGDPSAAFAGCDAVVEGRFRTNWVYQAYLEPHSATAWIDPDGTLVVAASTQGTFYCRQQVARIYGLGMAEVRVIGTPLGGAFGSKVIVVEPLVAGAALVLRRPVRLTLTRREDFAATNPAPGAVIDVRAGARDGRLAALDARLVFDAGAYAEWSIEGIAAVLVAGPYRWPAFDIRAYGVRTNRFGTGSYRAPGAPQAAFAIESLVDELADRLGLDPVAFRLASLAEPGDPMVDGESWPRVGARECLDRVAESALWQRRDALGQGEGVGLALGYWPGGKEPAAAVCRLEPDGSLAVITGVVDMSGTTSTFGLIAADAFGVRPEAVRVVSLDTAGAPQSPLSGGSVITYSAGRAVQQAVLEARRQLLEYAAERLEIDPADLEIVDGVVRPLGSPDRGVTVASLAESLHDFGGTHPPVEGHAGTVHKSLAPSTSAHLSHVRVDPQTGQVEVVGHLAIQDVGRALNPALVRGQMHGGTVQGLGWALSEALQHDEQGQLLTGSFLDYAVPSAPGTPPVETVVVEVPAPDGPFGAKGIGEASVVPVAAAVANAVRRATGVPPRDLPIQPEWVWAALRPRREAGPDAS